MAEFRLLEPNSSSHCVTAPTGAPSENPWFCFSCAIFQQVCDPIGLASQSGVHEVASRRPRGKELGGGKGLQAECHYLVAAFQGRGLKSTVLCAVIDEAL